MPHLIRPLAGFLCVILSIVTPAALVAQLAEAVEIAYSAPFARTDRDYVYTMEAIDEHRTVLLVRTRGEEQGRFQLTVVDDAAGSVRQEPVELTYRGAALWVEALYVHGGTVTVLGSGYRAKAGKEQLFALSFGLDDLAPSGKARKVAEVAGPSGRSFGRWDVRVYGDRGIVAAFRDESATHAPHGRWHAWRLDLDGTEQSHYAFDLPKAESYLSVHAVSEGGDLLATVHNRGPSNMPAQLHLLRIAGGREMAAAASVGPGQLDGLPHVLLCLDGRVVVSGIYADSTKTLFRQEYAAESLEILDYKERSVDFPGRVTRGPTWAETDRTESLWLGEEAREGVTLVIGDAEHLVRSREVWHLRSTAQSPLPALDRIPRDVRLVQRTQPGYGPDMRGVLLAPDGEASHLLFYDSAENLGRLTGATHPKPATRPRDYALRYLTVAPDGSLSERPVPLFTRADQQLLELGQGAPSPGGGFVVPARMGPDWRLVRIGG